MSQSKRLNDAVRTLLQEPDPARPFLCEGAPLDCDVFLVGINPGTTTEFCPAWSTTSRCDKQKWLESYRTNHGGKLGKTRAMIEEFVQAAKPLKILEANIFPYASPREKDLPRRLRTTTFFELLLREIKPRILFIHGKSARRAMEALTGQQFERGRFVPAELDGIAFSVRCEHQFSYQWSYAGVRQAAQETREHYDRLYHRAR